MDLEDKAVSNYDEILSNLLPISLYYITFHSCPYMESS